MKFSKLTVKILQVCNVNLELFKILDVSEPLRFDISNRPRKKRYDDATFNQELKLSALWMIPDVIIRTVMLSLFHCPGGLCF